MFGSYLEVLRLLEQSNCHECGEKTCLAFAAKVHKGERQLGQCSRLSPDVAARYANAAPREASQQEKDQQAMIEELTKRVLQKDLSDLAALAGGEYKGGRLTVPVLGKPMSMDASGRFYADIHLNPWVVTAVLGYLAHCKGVPLSGRWVTFRDLPGGREMYPLFAQGALSSLKKIADRDLDLFRDLLMTFEGQPTDSVNQPDMALALPILPRLPILVCYWQADEEGMESELQLLCDDTAVANAGVETVFSLGQGVARMLDKIYTTQGWRDLARN